MLHASCSENDAAMDIFAEIFGKLEGAGGPQVVTR